MNSGVLNKLGERLNFVISVADMLRDAFGEFLRSQYGQGYEVAPDENFEVFPNFQTAFTATKKRSSGERETLFIDIMPNGLAKIVVENGLDRIEVEENLRMFDDPEDAAVHVLTTIMALNEEHDPSRQLLHFIRAKAGYDPASESSFNAQFNHN